MYDLLRELTAVSSCIHSDSKQVIPADTPFAGLLLPCLQTLTGPQLCSVLFVELDNPRLCANLWVRIAVVLSVLNVGIQQVQQDETAFAKQLSDGLQEVVLVFTAAITPELAASPLDLPPATYIPILCAIQTLLPLVTSTSGQQPLGDSFTLQLSAYLDVLLVTVGATLKQRRLARKQLAATTSTTASSLTEEKEVRVALMSLMSKLIVTKTALKQYTAATV
jgi:hypothetical protein